MHRGTDYPDTRRHDGQSSTAAAPTAFHAWTTRSGTVAGHETSLILSTQATACSANTHTHAQGHTQASHKRARWAKQHSSSTSSVLCLCIPRIQPRSHKKMTLMGPQCYEKPASAHACSVVLSLFQTLCEPSKIHWKTYSGRLTTPTAPVSTSRRASSPLFSVFPQCHFFLVNVPNICLVPFLRKKTRSQGQRNLRLSLHCRGCLVGCSTDTDLSAHHNLSSQSFGRAFPPATVRPCLPRRVCVLVPSLVISIL
jgi:hypothetical protein